MKSAVTLSLVSEATGGPFVFWHDKTAAARAALDLGFDGIEIFAPDAETIKQLNWATSYPNLPIAALGTGAGWVKHRLLLSDKDPNNRSAAVDFVTSFLQVASETKSKVIIGSMQGRSSATQNRTESLDLLRLSLEQLDQVASKYEVELLFEPLNRYETDLINTVEQAANLVSGLNSTYVLADLFHMNIEERYIEDSLRQWGAKIGHIHFADTNRQAVGLGHLSVHKIIDALRDINYSGYLSAEVLAKPDSMEAARQTMESFRKYCVQ